MEYWIHWRWQALEIKSKFVADAIHEYVRESDVNYKDEHAYNVVEVRSITVIGWISIRTSRRGREWDLYVF